MSDGGHGAESKPMGLRLGDIRGTLISRLFMRFLMARNFGLVCVVFP